MKRDDQILILGGGFGGARLAQDLAHFGFSDVTLVDRKDYFEVTYATLRALVDPAIGDRARMRYEDFLKVRFRRGELKELASNHATLQDGTRLAFDVAVVATGSSYRSLPIAKSHEALSLPARAEEVDSQRAQLRDANTVLIVGGGPVGVELAGEIMDRFPNKDVTLVEGGHRLLRELKPKASEIARNMLERRGVKVRTDTRLIADSPSYRNADIVYLCIGLEANTDFMHVHFSSSLDPQLRIKVSDCLRMEGSNTIYAIGDCARLPQVKFGYVADAQAAFLARRFHALAKGRSTRAFKSPPLMSLVPVGRDSGLVQLPFAVSTLGLLVNMKQKDMFIGRQYRNLGVKR